MTRQTSVVHPVQEFGVLDRDAGRRYFFHAVAVILLAGVRWVQRERSDGSDQRGNGTVLGRHARSRWSVHHSVRVRHVRLIVHYDFATDLKGVLWRRIILYFITPRSFLRAKRIDPSMGWQRIVWLVSWWVPGGTVQFSLKFTVLTAELKEGDPYMTIKIIKYVKQISYNFKT